MKPLFREVDRPEKTKGEERRCSDEEMRGGGRNQHSTTLRYLGGALFLAAGLYFAVLATYFEMGEKFPGRVGLVGSRLFLIALAAFYIGASILCFRGKRKVGESDPTSMKPSWRVFDPHPVRVFPHESHVRRWIAANLTAILVVILVILIVLPLVVFSPVRITVSIRYSGSHSAMIFIDGYLERMVTLVCDNNSYAETHESFPVSIGHHTVRVNHDVASPGYGVLGETVTA